MSRKCSTKLCCVNSIDFLSSRLHRLAESIPRLIRVQESIPGLIKSLKIRALQTGLKAKISSSNLRPDLRMSQSNGSRAICLSVCFILMSFLIL
jgi:hypothetical protein